jgi:MFS family permease
MTIPNSRSKPSGPLAAAAPPETLKPLFFIAWLLCAVFYFFQYAVRSAPGIMQGELSEAWGGNRIGSMISAYYVAYAVMALVAGVLLDRYGAKRTIPLGIAVVALGCLLFSQGSEAAGMIGFVLQALGAIFAFIGSSYVAARYLPGRMLALFIGLTQCLGMAGAAFGSKPVHMVIDPAGSFGVAWQHVWVVFAIVGLVLAITDRSRRPIWSSRSASSSATRRAGWPASSVVCCSCRPRSVRWCGPPRSCMAARTCRCPQPHRTPRWFPSAGSSAARCSATSRTSWDAASRC